MGGDGVVDPGRCQSLLRQLGYLGGLDELHDGVKDYEATAVDKLIPSAFCTEMEQQS